MQLLNRLFSATCVAGALTLAFAPIAGAQAKPADATAQCKDGSYSEAKTERGACSGHGGVGTWYGAAKADAKPAAKETGKTIDKDAKAAAPTATTKTAAVAPTDATGQCKDGTYTKAKTQRGACSGHGGVGTWMAGTAGAPAAASTSSPSRPVPVPPPAATANPPATASPTPSSSTKASNIQTPPVGAPENATAQCNDGTFSMAKEHRGACSGHKGVKAWFK